MPPRTRVLTLASVRPPRDGGNAANRQYHEQAAQAQLERCEAYLARERDPKAPRWVRCECCGGRAEANVGHPRCRVAA